ncbi:hypothetical protein ACQPZG_11445 [Streptomyces sp. CA-294286]|uniref:hypothetical protein n=1 Tax=Streptomyces sp. CA-294286 TaxID=3240070 RepID=UPI003D8BBF80
MGTTATAVVAAVLSGVLLAGCGTGNGGPTETGTTTEAASPTQPTGSTPPTGNGAPPSPTASPSAPPSQPGSPPPSGTPPPSGSPPPSGTPSPPPSVPGKGRLLVTATVSGGIDGRHRSVLVHADGSYTTLDRSKGADKGRMRPAALTELRDALAASDFASLPRMSVADPPVADGIMTAVAYRGREVVTDGTRKVPGLDRVIAALPALDP